MPSFDIVNKLDMQIIDDAINDANRKISQRYDFKGAKILLELNKKEKTLKVEAPDNMKMEAVQDIVMETLIKKGVSAKVIDWGKREDATLGSVRLNCKLVEGIAKDHAKTIQELIKDSGIKVKASIQGEQLRVDGKSIDDLQEVMALLKGANLAVPVQFDNMKR